MTFHDIRHIIEGLTAPSMESIKEILDFAKENEVDMVCCYAGISRSSAVAYLIKCLTEEPECAIKVLDELRHHPNKRIIKIGSKLLKNDMIEGVYNKWIEKS